MAYVAKCFVIFLTVFTLDLVVGRKILLSDLATLTLREGEMTTSRRSSPVPQLKCVAGGNAGCDAFKPRHVQCYNRGSDGYDIQWECKTDMDNKYRFGKVDVSCEGYEYADDPYVLAGSCGLEYTIDPTSSNTKSSAYFSSNSKSSNDKQQPEQTSPFSGFGFICVLMVIFFVYRTWFAAPTSGVGESYGNGNPNPNMAGSAPPPPPYTERSTGGSSSYNNQQNAHPQGPPPPYGFNPDFTQQQQQQQQKQYTSGPQPQPQQQQQSTPNNNNGQPGFFSGILAGGLMGYLFGNRGGSSGYNGYNRAGSYYSDGYERDWFGSPRGGGASSLFGGGGSGMGGGSSMSSGSRTSSGFGGTKRR